MCGRYAASRSAADLVEEFGVAVAHVGEGLEADYNVAPTKDVYAVLERTPKDEPQAPPQRELRVVRWGLVPSWAKDPSIGNRLINARAETVAEKPSFRKAFAARRCLLPADGFYEWRPMSDEASTRRPRKQPYFIHPAGGDVMAMAGLYELWRDPDGGEDPWLWTVTVITTDATDDVGHIHERMPMLVAPKDWAAWLDPSRSKPEELAPLMAPAVPGRLASYPVSTAVNNVRNNGPDLLAPAEVVVPS